MGTLVYYSRFVTRFLFRALPGAPLGAAAFALMRPLRLRWLREERLRSSAFREAVLLLFWLYCGALAVLTLTPHWVDWYALLRGTLPAHPPWFTTGTWIFSDWRHILRPGWERFILLGNLAAFAPMGAASALLWRGGTCARAVLAGLGASCFIECTQLLVGRCFDCSDMVLNAAGAAAGYWLWRGADALSGGRARLYCADWESGG